MKTLEQCANCLHVQTFYDSQRVYKFYQIFPEGSDSERRRQLSLLIDLIIPSCFLKKESFSKCDLTRFTWEQLNIQILQTIPDPNSFPNTMLIPLSARTTTFGMNLSRRISLVISGYPFNIYFLFPLIIKLLNLYPVTSNIGCDWFLQQ